MAAQGDGGTGYYGSLGGGSSKAGRGGKGGAWLVMDGIADA
jgi:hypothetical protein